MFVEPVRDTPVPEFAPNLTVTPDRKLEPVIVTTVPPLVSPVVGVTPVMTGAVGAATLPTPDTSA